MKKRLPASTITQIQQQIDAAAKTVDVTDMTVEEIVVDSWVDQTCDELLRQHAEEGLTYFCPFIGSTKYAAHQKRHMEQLQKKIAEACARIGSITS